MKYSLKTKEINPKASVFLYLTIVLMGMFLNQSSVMFGINFSFADVFCCVALLILIFKNRLLIPCSSIMFFFIVSISVIITAVFFVPIKFLYSSELQSIISDYIKLIAVFLYFIIGYNIVNLGYTNKILQKYCIFALCIAIIGVIFASFNIKAFSQVLFWRSARLRGLMNDPNYFSVLQLAALIYFTRHRSINVWVKTSAILFIVASIFASGSKTGLITLLCYIIFRAVEHLIKSKGKFNTLRVQIALVVLLLLTISIASGIFQNIIQYIATIIPAFARLEIIFTDFNAAVSEGGSCRNAVWRIALEIIKTSPIVGIGIGTYSGIAEQLFGSSAIAHNTYLQLFAEWGIPLTLILFCYIFYMVCKATFSKKTTGEINLILRDILIVFLIGSLGISLNNARLFWLIFGALVFNMNSNKKSLCETDNVEKRENSSCEV